MSINPLFFYNDGRNCIGIDMKNPLAKRTIEIDLTPYIGVEMKGCRPILKHKAVIIKC